MTQLEALKIAYEELSCMMPDDENDDIFEAADIIMKMIQTKKKQAYKKQLKNLPQSSADRKRMKEINSMFDDLLKNI